MCDALATIESSPRYRALNIANAAAIILYLASRAETASHGEQTRIAREVFAKSLSELGEASGEPEHRLKGFPMVGKRLATSSDLTDVQLNFLTGVFRKATGRIRELQERDSNT